MFPFEDTIRVLMTDKDYDLVWDERIHSYVRVPKLKLPEREGAQVIPERQRKICECGVAALGYDVGHSSWCPANE
jgi:hypothetical protein